MAKYNFKKFFEEVEPIHNSDWVTNGHFAIRKDFLTKAQLKHVDSFPMQEDKMKTVDSIIKQTQDESCITEFKPQTIANKLDPMLVFFKHTEQNSEEVEFCLNGLYYHFIQSRKCTIHITEGLNRLKPMSIYNNNNEFVGIVLPMKVDEGVNTMSYNEWLEQEAQAKRERAERRRIKKLNSKKCLYISNNKAVTRDVEVTSIASILMDKKFKNIYIESNYKENYGEVFIDMGFILMGTGITLDKHSYIRDRLEQYTDFTFNTYKQIITKRLEKMQFINVAEIKLMELSGEFDDEYIQKLKDHREQVLQLRDMEIQKQEEKREQEEQEYLQEQDKELQDIITAAEQEIINKGRVKNIDVTEYKSRYESSTTSLILYLMRQHNIKVPLKTQGWINKALVDVYYDDEIEDWTYRYYTSSANSTVFSKYLKLLVEAVKNKHIIK